MMAATPKMAMKPLGLAPLPGAPPAQPVFLQGGIPAGMPPGAMPSLAPQRVLHRHVHHHVHYHEGQDEGQQPKVVTSAEQRHLEDSCEARVRQQLEAQPPRDDMYHGGGGMETPMRKAASVGSIG